MFAPPCNILYVEHKSRRRRKLSVLKCSKRFCFKIETASFESTLNILLFHKNATKGQFSHADYLLIFKLTWHKIFFFKPKYCRVYLKEFSINF